MHSKNLSQPKFWAELITATRYTMVLLTIKAKGLVESKNAAARLILGKKKRDHITPLLRHLHWLPIKARTEYKVASLAFQLFDGTLPPSLSKTIKKKDVLRSLRSSNERLIDLQRHKLESAGGRAFSISAPKIWNGLPNFIRNSNTMPIFKKRLKTYLFQKYLSWQNNNNC